MGIGYEIGSAIGGAAASLFNTGFNIWANNRDFDYQKSLQQEIFNREDTAVQRRVKDLEAAGLNPNLAAGSSAGAGAVVGRSNTPSLSGNSIGTALDMASAVQQLRAQRKQNEILNNQIKESRAKVNLAEAQAANDLAYLYLNLGFMPDIEYKFGDDKPIQFSFDGSRHGLWNTPLGQMLDWQMMNNKNSAYILEKDYENYDTDRFFRYLGSSASALSNFGNFGKTLKGMRMR